MTTYVVPTRKERLVRIPLFCRIEPLSRPKATVLPGQRFAKIYVPKANQRTLLANLGALTPMGYDQPVMVDLYINFKKAPTSKLHFPLGKNHGDEDNLRKAVCDALVEKGHLKDDALIMGGQTTKWFGEEDFAVIDVYSVHMEPHRYDV